jgi:puromycin-sensitive aminopeptidase
MIRVTNGNFLPSYFATPYPLPKLDMIAIPDFAAGAMENYGLVTYRDTALLYDELLSSASNKQQVRDTFGSNSFHWLLHIVSLFEPLISSLFIGSNNCCT